MPGMLAKLSARGVPERFMKVFESWINARSAKVVVSGRGSERVVLENMVFQGTVWGPPLWNNFYADSAKPIRKQEFTEIVFADDLNAQDLWKRNQDAPNPCRHGRVPTRIAQVGQSQSGCF